MTDLFQSPADEARPARKTKAKPVAATPEAQPETSVEASVGALVAQTTENPVAVFTDEAQFSEFYDRLKAETDKHVVDLTTDKGRKAVASLAFKVTKAKTTLVAAGKGLTEEWRRQTALVNASRNKMEAELDGLAAEVRRPLTEWEAKEKARADRNAATIRRVMDDGIVREDDTAASVEARGREVYGETIGDDWTDDERARWDAAKVSTVKALVAARDRLRQEEADRAELARLRQEAVERAERDAAAQAERDAIAAAEQAKRDAEEAEAQRVREAEQAAERERQRIADAEMAAARRASEEAAAAARREQEARDAEHARQLAEARERAEQVEREAAAQREAVAKAERERVAAEEAAQAERDRLAAEDAKRARNRAHVAAVMGAAKDAIMTTGVTEDQARAIVVAIKAGLVPAVGITF